MAEGKFGTCINCMDGRVQEPMIEFMKKGFDLDYIDMITEPGPDAILGKRESGLVELIRGRVLLSIQKHGSDTIVLVSHGDCAGNPVSYEEHLSHLRKGMETIRSWDLDADIYGVWIDDKDWKVDIVASIER
ncbi:MAG TPA: hypothetical protein PLF13_03640 [candidate division Zixibacteria bacterium]|nr:hypothetical protein [candidate division Zixibacteria bacterium]